MTIEEFEGECSEEILDFAIRAWEPVFRSIRETIGEDLFGEFYGGNWVEAQRIAISEAFADDQTHVWIAIVRLTPVGFVAVKAYVEDQIGEIHMIAVDPDHQHEQIGKALSEHALNWMRSAGLKMAMTETGNDPGHHAARALYASVGFTAWPAVKYFKKL